MSNPLASFRSPLLSNRQTSKLLKVEQAMIDEILPRLFGYHLIQIGNFPTNNLTSLIHHKILIHSWQECEENLDYHKDHSVLTDSKETTDHITDNAEPLSLICHYEALPFRTHSIDVIVLPHVLEQSINPHELLRECHRVLIPGGHIVITGFNPFKWTLWFCHLKHQCLRIFNKKLPILNPISLFRLKDWLKLLDLSVVVSKPFFFKVPLHDKIDKYCRFLDKYGPKWWPFLAGAYLIVAQKQEIAMTPIRLKNHKRFSFVPKEVPKASFRTKD